MSADSPAIATPPPVVQVRDMDFCYGASQALFDINLKVEYHRVTALIGPSGCGKSTLLRCVNRMNDRVTGARVTKGEVLVKGKNIHHADVDLTQLRKQVGMVFQKSNPFPKSIYENVAYGLRIHGEKSKSVLDEAVERSLTGQYLSGRIQISAPTERRKPDKRKLVIRGASQHNLRNIDVEIPLGELVCITGVSGSGKSTLMSDILYNELAAKLMGARTQSGEHKNIEGIEHLDKIINIDQSPIGRTPRSNPGTYTGLFDEIRKLFAELPESKVRGYKPGRFSFNVHGGRCEACQGQGELRIEMQFLPDVYVPCDVCHGKRFNRETLQVLFRDTYSISDVLDMTVDKALEEFKNYPHMLNKLTLLQEVGLGYVRVGQPATTLSGGEAQRVKLSKELSRRATGRTLYVLDEPSVGLHAADVHKLIEVLQRLVDTGNAVLIIEHNLDIIKVADWLIDLGPEGGDRGGELLAEGTPEQVMKVKSSYTGKYLKEHLGR